MIYEPREDSFLLEREIKKVARGKSVLDMGTGSGIQARAAKSAGAKSVLACDINPEAVKTIKKEKIEAVQSNLFSKISGKFDIIAFNPPYLPKDKMEDKESQLATTGGKKGDEIIIRFLKSAAEHLNKNGIILIIVSSQTPKERIMKVIKENSLSYTVLSSEKMFFEVLEVWKIERAKTK